MQKILLKHSPNTSLESLVRQISNSWKKFNESFVFTSDESEDYDWVIVLHHSGLTEDFYAKVPRTRCVYISMEPTEALCGISEKFAAQFGVVVSADPDIKHENLIKFNGHSWWVGLSMSRTKSGHLLRYDGTKDYKYFASNNFGDKLNKISVIASSNPHLPGHFLRDKLIKSITESSLSDCVDVYGKGYLSFDDKIAAIAPYKYHLVIENVSQANYWSEKIADPFLCQAMPIYFGCGNIDEYFPFGSLVHLKSLEPDYVLGVLGDVVFGCEDDLRKSSLDVAKKRVLDDYNLFTLIANICEGAPSMRGAHKLRTNVYLQRGYLYSTARRIYKKLYN